MQPDRRHDLETNDLADTVAAFVARMRPQLGAIGLVAAAAVIGLAGWNLVQSRRAAAREESWEACSAAFNPWQPSVIEDVTARYAGTPAAEWARLILADAALDQAIPLLLQDRAAAEQRLRAAESGYAAVLAVPAPAAVTERATFGLAKVRESLGNLDEAVRGYEAIVREHPDGALRPFAEERIAALGRKSTREWYAWLAQQKPASPPADAATPSQAPAAGAVPAAGDTPAAPGAPAGTGTGAAG